MADRSPNLVAELDGDGYCWLRKVLEPAVVEGEQSCLGADLGHGPFREATKLDHIDADDVCVTHCDLLALRCAG